MYKFRAKQDIFNPTASSNADNQSPYWAWINGIQGVSAFSPILTPFHNSLLQRLYSISVFKRFKLASGATRMIVYNERRPRWVNWLEVRLANLYMLKGSVCLFLTAVGQPVGSSAEQFLGNNANIRLKLMNHERYQFKYIQPAAPTFSVTDDRSAITYAQQLGVMRGQVQFAAGTAVMPQNAGAATAFSTANL